MRTLRVVIALLSAVMCVAAASASAADAATATVLVSVQFSSRTLLRVSSDLLQFDVAAPGTAATAAIDFSAAARTQASAEVLLSVEPTRGADGAALTFAGEGTGTVDGALSALVPTVAARWTGSGVRDGRLVFALRAGASGRYVVPLHFVLSAP
jgi:hypothetical protein